MLKMADKQKNTAQESTAKLQRRIDKLSVQLSESEERYIEMHQKYIDEKRDNEEKLAIMQEYMDNEIISFKEEAELHKERVKMIQQEQERVVAVMQSSEGLKDQAAIDIDHAEQRFMNVIHEREETERYLRQVISDKKAALDENSARVRELERMLVAAGTENTRRERIIKENLENEIEEVKEQLTQKIEDNEELGEILKEMQQKIVELQTQIRQSNDTINYLKTSVIPGYEDKLRSLNADHKKHLENQK